jgi:hypothetical protein
LDPLSSLEHEIRQRHSDKTPPSGAVVAKGEFAAVRTRARINPRNNETRATCDRQKADADLEAALVEQFRQALPDADDAEIARHVAECLARMQEELK